MRKLGKLVGGGEGCTASALEGLGWAGLDRRAGSIDVDVNMKKDKQSERKNTHREKRRAEENFAI